MWKSVGVYVTENVDNPGIVHNLRGMCTFPSKFGECGLTSLFPLHSPGNVHNH